MEPPAIWWIFIISYYSRGKASSSIDIKDLSVLWVMPHSVASENRGAPPQPPAHARVIARNPHLGGHIKKFKGEPQKAELLNRLKQKTDSPCCKKFN
jgi:hypothetical protein